MSTAGRRLEVIRIRTLFGSALLFTLACSASGPTAASSTGSAGGGESGAGVPSTGGAPASGSGGLSSGGSSGSGMTSGSGGFAAAAGAAGTSGGGASGGAGGGGAGASGGGGASVGGRASGGGGGGGGASGAAGAITYEPIKGAQFDDMLIYEGNPPNFKTGAPKEALNSLGQFTNVSVPMVRRYAMDGAKATGFAYLVFPGRRLLPALTWTCM